ncbi:MAG: NACHT domain-containing protein, partial [Candidatus Bathyarchaeia archaeon]
MRLRQLVRRGLKDGRDVCGPLEKGKDAIFVAIDQLDMSDVYVVQTKRGNLNLARKASQNIVEAITQLKTALATKVIFISTREKKLPSKVVLCASGKINDSARQHILDQVDDPRIIFMDSDDLIPSIDEIYPELWFGIDAQILPYLRALKQHVEVSSESLPMAEVLPQEGMLGAATDKMFVSLRLWRPFLKLKRERGKVERVPEFEELPIIGILGKRARLVLILGEAGSGKSTSLKRLAYVLAEKAIQGHETLMIPVLLRASDLCRTGRLSLVEICANETKRLAGSSTPSFSIKELEAGQVVIFIDALDEIHDDSERVAVLRSVIDFHRLYPKCQIIVTSRDYAFVKDLEELSDFTEYRLSPINYRQAEQLVERLQKGKGLPVEMSKEIIRRLHQVHGMELNPLLVTVFVATTDYSRLDIPANITELFKKFTEMMLGRWDATKGLAHQYHAPLKDFILTKVAFEMHRREITSIGLTEFKSIVENELTSRGHKADVKQLLDEILNRSGLFRVIGETIDFRHLLLQEFFA